MVVSKIEDFGGQNIPSRECFLQLFKEEEAWFGLQMLVRVDGEIGGDRERAEGLQNQRGVKLGIGNDGDLKVARKLKSGHRPNVVGKQFVVKGQSFGIVVGVELSPNVSNFDFGILDSFRLGPSVMVGDEIF